MKRLLEGWREKLSERSRRSSEIRGKNYKEFIEYLKGLGNSFVVFELIISYFQFLSWIKFT